MEDDKPFRVDYTAPNTGDKILSIYIRAANLTLAKHFVENLPYTSWSVKNIIKDTEENYQKSRNTNKK